MTPRLLLILIAVLVLRLQLATAIHDVGMYQLDQQKLAHRGLGCLWLAAEMVPEDQRFQRDYLDQWISLYQAGKLVEWQVKPVMPMRACKADAIFNEDWAANAHEWVMRVYRDGAFFEQHGVKFRK